MYRQSHGRLREFHYIFRALAMKFTRMAIRCLGIHVFKCRKIEPQSWHLQRQTPRSSILSRDMLGESVRTTYLRESQVSNALLITLLCF